MGAADRSEAAQAYRRLYKTARWQKLRAHQLAAEPLCRFCADAGRLTPASVVDHIEPHRGDLDLFFRVSNLQSLCDAEPWRCHSKIKQIEERHAEADKRRGYSTEIGLDGWPVDPAHPMNRR